MSESEICTAAFFLSRGKDLVTQKEFTISVFIDLRWMSSKTAPGLVNVLVSDGCMEYCDGYLKPTFDVNSVKVPLDYKPSAELVARSESMVGAKIEPPAKKPEPPPAPPEEEEEEDVFGKLMAVASKNGIDNREFAKRSRAVSKELGVPPAVAGLLILRDAGIDVSEFSKDAEREIISKRSLLLGLDEASEGHSAGLSRRLHLGRGDRLVQLDAEGLLQLGNDLVVGDEGTVDDLADGELLLADGGGVLLHGHAGGPDGVADDLPRVLAQDGGLGPGVDVPGLHAPLALLEPLLDHLVGGRGRGTGGGGCPGIVVFRAELGAVHAQVHTDTLDGVGAGSDVLSAHLA